MHGQLEDQVCPKKTFPGKGSGGGPADEDHVDRHHFRDIIDFIPQNLKRLRDNDYAHLRDYLSIRRLTFHIAVYKI